MALVVIETEELITIVQDAVKNALSEKNRADEDVMKVEDLQRYLKMPKNTIYSLTHQGTIPFSKKGGSLFFSKKEIDLWLEQGKQVQNLKQEEQEMKRLKRIQRANKLTSTNN